MRMTAEQMLPTASAKPPCHSAPPECWRQQPGQKIVECRAHVKWRYARNANVRAPLWWLVEQEAALAVECACLRAEAHPLGNEIDQKGRL